MTSLMLPSQAETARDIRPNCREALREMDIAICADPVLLDADIALNDAVRSLLDSSDDENCRAALLADQRMFFAIRGEASRVKLNRTIAAARLFAETFHRMQRLRDVTPHPAAGLEGRWENAWGRSPAKQAQDIVRLTARLFPDLGPNL